MEPPPFVNVHFFDLARRAGHAEAEARALQAQVVGVTGASEKRAVELLLMADFDINRAAEYHFTHPEDVQEAEVSEVSDTTGLQQVQVQATAPAGQTPKACCWRWRTRPRRWTCSWWTGRDACGRRPSDVTCRRDWRRRSSCGGRCAARWGGGWGHVSKIRPAPSAKVVVSYKAQRVEGGCE